MADLISGILRSMFYDIDKIIYGFIDDIYALVLQLARTTLFDSAMIETFSKRIYAFIGIFMLFKVSISLLTYVLNPDEFSDKEKGFTSVIKRVVFSLVLVVLVPYIFAEAYKLQTYILEDNTLLTLVFGTPSQEEMVANSSYTEVAGKKLQFTVLYAFVQPNYEQFTSTNPEESVLPYLESCRETYVMGEDGKFAMRETPVINDIASKESGYIYALNTACWGTYDPDNDVYSGGELQKLFNNDESSVTDVKINSVYQSYAQGVAQQDFSMFFSKELIEKEYENEELGIKRYVIDYNWGISTIAGVAVLYLLLLFCIDIAIRSVKLGFLQMISPIPIISYCDPKSGKDGMFKKWVDMCVKTYLDLFIRLFALYFGIYVISLIGTFKDVITEEPVVSNVVNVFMIIGVLIFAKKLPEILKDVFGFKGDMKFNLNPIKRFEDEALLGKNITGLAAGAAIGTAGMLTGAGIGRGLSGAWQGLRGGKGWSDTLKNARDKNATMRTARLNGSTFGGRLGAGFSNALGTGGELARIEREKDEISTSQKKYDDQIKSIEDQKKAVQQSIAPTKQKIADRKAFADSISAMEKRAKEEIEKGNGGAIGTEFLRRKATLEHLKATGAGANDIAAAEKAMNDYLNDAGMKEYMTNAINGSIDDKTFESMYKSAQQKGQTIGETLSDEGKDIHAQFGKTKGAIGDFERSIYAEEQIIAQYEQDITEINGRKAKLGDRMRDIEKRESVAKANQDAIK